MIIDHLGVAVENAERSTTFFTRALAPLGIEPLMEVRGWTGFGRLGKAQFWIGEDTTRQTPLHIAFVAETREQVSAFHAEALAAGGTDNGPPGIRDTYHPDYFAAFVTCPDGHNIEAVCHRAEP